MNDRNMVYRKIAECGIIPTVFVYDMDETCKLAKTLYDNGIQVLELLQRTELALAAIQKVKEYVPGMVVGAGTVLDTVKAEQVLREGADYIVSPYYHQEIVDWCNEHEIATIPGCSSISEISRGYDSGLRFFKLFPANQLGGPAFVRQISEIYADARYVPAGGITLDDVKNYSASRYIGAMGTVCMMPQALISAHDWKAIAALTKKTVAASLGLELVMAPKLSACVGEPVQSAVEGRNWDKAVPPEALERCPDADLVFYTNSVERSLAYFRDRGLECCVLLPADAYSAAAGLAVDGETGQKLLLIARHYLTYI